MATAEAVRIYGILRVADHVADSLEPLRPRLGISVRNTRIGAVLAQLPEG
jgi:hypothetical protein